MKFLKEHLDTPISMLIEEAENEETVREFIHNSEEAFGMEKADVEAMDEEELNRYVEHLDDLWNK